MGSSFCDRLRLNLEAFACMTRHLHDDDDLFRGIWLSEQFMSYKKYYLNVLEFLEG